MPYNARPFRRAGRRTISWKEMETIDTPAHWHVGDAAELVKHAGSKTLVRWGRTDQVLPEL
ncbi:hypothetical protein [Sphingomonas sp. QA11]|uniref:hypothetical protein n=1 Tax=Sphingomonas sp. QA11 TaxID=2950605 RepID=UPI003FA70F8F